MRGGVSFPGNANTTINGNSLTTPQAIAVGISPQMNMNGINLPIGIPQGNMNTNMNMPMGIPVPITMGLNPDGTPQIGVPGIPPEMRIPRIMAFLRTIRRFLDLPVATPAAAPSILNFANNPPIPVLSSLPGNTSNARLGYTLRDTVTADQGIHNILNELGKYSCHCFCIL